MFHPRKLMAAFTALAVGAGLGWGASALAGGATTDGAPLAAPSGARALLGRGINDTMFVPITPCRIVDTRLAGGKLSTSGSRVFDVRGTGPTFAAQGGTAGGCGIPGGATAVEATITAIDSGPGFLRAWPANATPANATFLNYDRNDNVTNTGTLAIDGCTTICALDADLRIRTFSNPAHVVVEVNGYYERQMAAAVSNTGSLVQGNRVVATSQLSTGLYRVDFDRDIAKCAAQATVDAGYGDGWATADIVDGGFATPVVYVKTVTAAGSVANRGFWVTVTC